MNMNDENNIGNYNQVLGVSSKDKFSVSSYTLNKISISDNDESFPGNIAPEGYFYCPFYEVKLKELDDEIKYIDVKRVNFNPELASVTTAETLFYDVESGSETLHKTWTIKIKSPISYNIIHGQPFCVYDVQDDLTYRCYLEEVVGTEISILSRNEIDEYGLRGKIEGCEGKSRYIISFLTENAPEYAEFVPSSQRLVWRGVKNMSELSSDSPLYNMPFTNGRLYIHENVNFYVRRQDPHGDFNLYRPSDSNPLRRFQIEGDPKIDFDYLETIKDTMVDAC